MAPRQMAPATAPSARDGDEPTATLLTPRRIGDVNRSRILRALCEHGPRSRAELARLADVPRATIGKITLGMIRAGLLEEQSPDRTRARVGKPGRPLWFGEHSGMCGAVTFATDHVRAAVVNARGEVLTTTRVDLDTTAASPAALRRTVLKALAGAVRRRESLLGVGLAIPGVCDTTTGEVLGSGPLPGAVGRHLAEALQAEGYTKVLVDNDARVEALAEKWFGEGRGVATFAAIQTGAGLGVGLVLDEALYRGDDGRTGELGHTRVTDGSQRCRCGLIGCWETIATLDWLRAEARRRGFPKSAGITSGTLAAAERSGNATAAALLDSYAENLARGLSTLVNLLGVRLLLLHGDVVDGGPALLTRLDRALRVASLPSLREDLRVVASALDRDAALLGAAGLVLSETFATAA
ncbi:MAG TPA: ROK family transcriptional regulator [Mycobacteriales bacterium]|nr:ROK family transcriptional regulator [Mycobacteriales bacterium]